MALIIRGKGIENKYGASGTHPGMIFAPEPDRLVSDPDQLAGIAAQERIANAQLNFEQDKFNRALGLLSNYQTTGGDPFAIGGRPQIDVGPIWNPQQIQQQVNAARGQNDQTMEARTQAMRQNLGARGFGSQSPLSQALGGMLQGQNLAQNTANEREVRMRAAGENAPHILRSQVARENALIERAKPYFQERNILLQALAGLV